MDIVIRGGRLVDGRGDRPDELERLEITGGVISNVVRRAGPASPGAEPAAGAVIEADGLWICPGLINAHVHLYLNGGRSPLAELEQESSHAALLGAARRAGVVLQAGVTTVRDAGAKDAGILALRQAIAAGLADGPRIIACGPALAMTGGHAHALSINVDGPEGVRLATRRLIQQGADFVKLFGTGGFGKLGERLDSYELDAGEIASAVETARAAGKKVAVHAYGNQGIRNALLAGAHSIEHASHLDDGTIADLLAKGVFLVPTLSNTHRVSTMGAEADLPAGMVETAKRVLPLMRDNFRKAWRAGLRLPAGTDGGSWLNPLEDLVTELKLRGDLGVPNADLIRMATITAAECLGLADQIGTVEPGKRADLVLVSGDPLEDITALANVKVVIQSGRIRRWDLARPPRPRPGDR